MTGPGWHPAGRRGSVLLEAILAMMIFMIGTAAVVTLMQGSLAALTRAELEGRVVPDVVGVPSRAGQDPAGRVEVGTGALEWRWEDGDAPSLEIEFVLTEQGVSTFRWRLSPVGSVP